MVSNGRRFVPNKLTSIFCLFGVVFDDDFRTYMLSESNDRALSAQYFRKKSYTLKWLLKKCVIGQNSIALEWWFLPISKEATDTCASLEFPCFHLKTMKTFFLNIRTRLWVLNKWIFYGIFRIEKICSKFGTRKFCQYLFYTKRWNNGKNGTLIEKKKRGELEKCVIFSSAKPFDSSINGTCPLVS